MNNNPPQIPVQNNLDELFFVIDTARSRDAIRWAHNRIRTEYPTFRQGFFLNAVRVGDHHHVQLYSEDRQLRILGYRLTRNPNLCNILYNEAQTVVNERAEGAGREIEIMDITGQVVSNIIAVNDFPANAFQQSLGTELMIDEVIKIEIHNDQAPNTIIMTLALDYWPIY